MPQKDITGLTVQKYFLFTSQLITFVFIQFLFLMSTLLYSTELWPLTVTLSKKLEAAHHRWLRGILGITWRDKVTNEEIQKRTRQTLLKKVIRVRRLRWLGHVTRMDEVHIPKQALQWKVAGFKRRPGRPRINWRDIVNKDLQRMGLTWE